MTSPHAHLTLAKPLALLVALTVWAAIGLELAPWSLWPSVLLIALVMMPATFAALWLALPFWRAPWLFPAAIVLVAAAVVAHLLDAEAVANTCKFAAVALLGWWFLSYFEALSWVVIVAAVIPIVDAYSVWRGPTKKIVEDGVAGVEVFDFFSVAFVVPGDAARLGLPDVLFFAVFLGAAVRFGLRPFATWVCLTGFLGLTIVLATWFEVTGLPALPALSLGFVLPNADLLWQRFRDRRAATDQAERSSTDTDST